MLVPNQNAIKLYNGAFKKSIIKDITDLVFNLHLKLVSIYNYKNLVFISVLRSGHFLSELLKHLIYELYKINVEIICVSPNYINNVKVAFKDYITSSKKYFIFIDGWMSRGVTYNVLRRFWRLQKIKKDFKMAVLSNLSIYNNQDIISSINQDILIPWSICQTDNLGLSNFFLHPETNEPTSFFISKNKLVVDNFLQECKRMISERIEKRKIIDNNFSYSRKRAAVLCQNNFKNRFIKIGINECIKSIDKGDVEKMCISKELKEPYFSILQKYNNINKIDFKFTDKKYSYVVKKRSQ